MDWLEPYLPYIEATATVLAAFATWIAARAAAKAAWTAHLSLQSKFTTNSISVGSGVTCTRPGDGTPGVRVRYITIDHHESPPEWRIRSVRIVNRYPAFLPRWLEIRIRKFRCPVKWISDGFLRIKLKSTVDPHLGAPWKRKLKYYDPIFRGKLLLHPDASGDIFVLMKVVSNVHDDVKRTVVRKIELPN